jgi:hypothetical protein
MSAIEKKQPGHYTGGTNVVTLGAGFDDDDDGWGTDVRQLSSDEFSYALGTKGSTRKKLAMASGCLLEYVGYTAFMCGFGEARRRCNDYLGWLLTQRSGSKDTMKVSVEGRSDVSVMKINREFVGFVTGAKGQTLREIEQMTGTFCFTDVSIRCPLPRSSLAPHSTCQCNVCARACVWSVSGCSADVNCSSCPSYRHRRTRRPRKAPHRPPMRLSGCSFSASTPSCAPRQ